MSGHKRATVTIDEHEYRRLHESDIQLRYYQNNKTNPNVAHYYQEAIRQDYDRLSLRQQQYQETISHLNTQVQQLEGYLTSSLVQQQEKITRQAWDITSNLWQEVNRLVDQQNENFRSQIDELQRQQTSIARRLGQVVHNLENDFRKKNELVESWIKAAHTILQFICDQYDHEKFSPGVVNQLYQEIQIAEENMISGMPEAALSHAQRVYTQSSDLRLRLEKFHQEWNLHYYAICAEYERVVELLASNWIVPAIDLEGKELEFPVEVDFWSQGRLSACAKRLQEIHEILGDGCNRFSSNDLQRIRVESIQAIELEIFESRFQARIEFLSSQIRINIADIALSALEKQGFLLQQSGYDRHDMRSSFTASSRHIDGSEVVVKVVPATDEDMGNHLHVLSSDANIRTRHELLLRSETIRRTLAEMGLELGPVTVETGPVPLREPLKLPARKVSENLQTNIYQ